MLWQMRENILCHSLHVRVPRYTQTFLSSKWPKRRCALGPYIKFCLLSDQTSFQWSHWRVVDISSIPGIRNYSMRVWLHLPLSSLTWDVCKCETEHVDLLFTGVSVRWRNVHLKTHVPGKHGGACWPSVLCAERGSRNNTVAQVGGLVQGKKGHKSHIS